MKKCIFILLSSVMLMSGCDFVKSDGDSYYLDAMQAYSNGEYADAIEKMKLAEEYGVETYEMGEVYKMLGKLYLELDMYDEAVVYFGR